MIVVSTADRNTPLGTCSLHTSEASSQASIRSIPPHPVAGTKCRHELINGATKLGFYWKVAVIWNQ